MNEDFLRTHSNKENPYRVPEGYFDTKEQDLKAIAGESVSNKTRVIGWQRPLSWVAGIAAAMLIGWLLFPQPDPVQQTVLGSEISDASIESYLLEEYNLGVVEEDVIINQLSSEDLEALEFEHLEEEDIEEFIDNRFDETLHYEYL